MSNNLPKVSQAYDVQEKDAIVFKHRLSPDISYDDFFRHYLLKNQPCIFSSEVTEKWNSCQQWVNKKTGKPNLAFLKEKFGDVFAPVADCGQEKYSSHCKQDMKISEFLDYWDTYMSEGHPDTMKHLYLKDWHFTKAFPSYQAYSTPEYFSSDWMNEFWDCRDDSDDDYRFVYMGPKGTWTPLHADVFHSYSWSANICGRKKWIFLPPGEEENYKDKFGSLVYDINAEELCDKSKYPRYSQSDMKNIEVIQEPGEVIFVPSGWHHQVQNLEDTISINHNWMNGCNVGHCWEFLKQNLRAVQSEIADCREMDGWHSQCQLILKASSGIDYAEFFRFMFIIAERRINLVDGDKLSHHSRDLCPQYKDSTNSRQNCDNTGFKKREMVPVLSSKLISSTVSTNVCHRTDPFNSCLVPKEVGSSSHQTQKDSEPPERPGTKESRVAKSGSATDTKFDGSASSENHAIFDLLSIKQVLTDMLHTEEFLEIFTDPDARTLLVRIDKCIENNLLK